MISEDEEQPAVKLTVSGHEALASDFKAISASLFSKGVQVGRRITVLPPDKLLTIYYVCPEKQAADLEPTYKKMVESVKLGQGGG